MGTKLRKYGDIMALHNRVTGSCIQVAIKTPANDGLQVLIDCGMYQENDEEEYNKKLDFNAKNIDYVFVTHNHVDHTGRLPLLIKNGYQGKIYCTQATKVLMPYALDDCCKVFKDISKVTKQKQLYNEEDVFETVAKLEEVEFGQTIELKKQQLNLKVTFLKNGHLLGAAMILLQIQCEDKYNEEPPINLLFTGDYNDCNMFFDVPSLPDWVRDLPLTIVMESTYGNSDSNTIEPCFKENISRKMMQDSGTIVVPVFSLGRCQEILKTLRDMQDDGRLDRSIPIYLDGKLAFKYTHIYKKYDKCLKEESRDFLPYDLKFIDDKERWLLMSASDRKIVVTTSGSGSYGPAPIYIQRFITESNALIHFTGFQFKDSLGRRLMTTEKGSDVKVNGMMLTRQADVEYTAEFSAHAKADQLITFLKQFNSLKFILLNHGEPEVKDEFAKRIKRETGLEKVGILERAYFFRVGPFGYVKSISSKFD